MPKIILAILIILIFGSIAPFIYGAHWAFYLYEMIYFLNPDNRWWSYSIPALPYSKISVIILFLTFFSSYKKYQKNKITQLPIFKWFSLLMISYALVYFYAIRPEYQEEAIIGYIKLFIIMGVAYKVIDSQTKLELALYAYILGATYLGYETYTVGRNSGDRVEGVGLVDAPNANGAAATIVPAFPLLIFYFWQGNKKVKLAMTIAGAFILNALVLINSRGAFVGTVVSVSYFLWKMYTSKIQQQFQKMTVIMITIMGLLSISVLIDDAFITRMQTLNSIEDEAASGSHRYRMWLSTFDLVADYPFGVGAYGYEALSPIYVAPELFDQGQKEKAVHSIWFQALAEVGWHGFSFFIMMILSTFRLAMLTKRKCLEKGQFYQYFLAHAILCSYLGVLVASTFINQFRVQIVYWTILFVACFYSIIMNDQHQSSEKNNKGYISRLN